MEHGSSILAHGSLDSLTHARILALCCLRLQSSTSLPPTEICALLKALGTLALIDDEFLYKWAQYFIFILNSQPKGLDGHRTTLLKFFGRVLGISTLSSPKIQDLASRCAQTIPKKQRHPIQKELLSTGLMWAHISSNKFGLFPSELFSELTASLASLSLPKIISSRESIRNCALLVDMAYRVVLSQENEKKKESAIVPLKEALTKLIEVIWTNIATIRKISDTESLERYTLRAMAATNFSKFWTRISGVLSDKNGGWSLKTKREALKCTFQRIVQHQEEEQLRTALFSEIEKLDSDAPLGDLYAQIKRYETSLTTSRGIGLPICDENGDKNWNGFSTFVFEDPTSKRTQITILKEPLSICTDFVANNSDGISEIEVLSKQTLSSSAVSQEESCANFSTFFDTMSSSDAVLELFNRYPLHVLEKMDELSSRNFDFENKAKLNDLQHLLQSSLANPEANAHGGWFKLYQLFESRYKAQREQILFCVLFPKLLSNSLFVYNLQRLPPIIPKQPNTSDFSSSKEAVMISLNGDTADTTLGSKNWSLMEVDDKEVSEEVAIDTRINLKKRKEMALKMIDDLEEEENVPKRIAPIDDLTHPIEVPSKESNEDHPIDFIHQQEHPETLLSPRITRSRSKPLQSIPDSSEKSKNTRATKKSASMASSESLEDDEAKEGENLKKTKKTAKKTAQAISESDKKKGEDKQKNKKEKSVQNKEKEAPKRSICNHWIQHRCYKGSECSFLHEGPQATFDAICKFHRTANCTKGSSCPFSHDLKSEACSNLVTSDNCKFGDRCAYSHDKEKINAAKAVAEARRMEEEAEKEKLESSKTLPFAQHLVPISFQPSFSDSSTTYASPFQPTYGGSGADFEGNSETQPKDDEAVSGRDIEEKNDSDTGKEDIAYVPISLSGLGANPKFSVSSAPVPSLAAPPTLITNTSPLAPPKL